MQEYKKYLQHHSHLTLRPPHASGARQSFSRNVEMTQQSDGNNATKGASTSSKDLAAHLRSIDSVPLFMKQLPGEDGNDKNGSATVLDALQSLTFDGTPDEVATSFKKQGNDYFVGKRYKEARSFYTQALDAYPTDFKLRETLLLNRAACNLAMSNFGSVLKDCSEALGLNEKSIKAFFRSAKALSELSRFVEAIDCCEHALLLDPDNTEVIQLRNITQQRASDAKRRQDEVEEAKRRQQQGRVALGQAFMARGLYIRASEKPPDNPHPAHFDATALQGTSSDPTLPLHSTSSSSQWRTPDPIRTPIVFPLVFLYPQYHQSDLVSHFHEDTTLNDQLSTIFPSSEDAQPLEWDANREYRAKNLNVFAITNSQRLLRIGKKLTLREAIDHCAQDADSGKGTSRDGMVMQDGILSLVVVPKGKAEQDWIDSFRRGRNQQKLA